MEYIEQHQLKGIRESTTLGVRLFSNHSKLSRSTIQNIELCKSVTTDNIQKYLNALSTAYLLIKNENKTFALVIKQKKE